MQDTSYLLWAHLVLRFLKSQEPGLDMVAPDGMVSKFSKIVLLKWYSPLNLLRLGNKTLKSSFLLHSR